MLYTYEIDCKYVNKRLLYNKKVIMVSNKNN